jgi:hypothetical protein
MQIRKKGDEIKKNSSYMLKSSSLCLYSSNLGTFWLKIEQFGHLMKFLFLVMAAILDTGRHRRTQFSKGMSFLTYITGFL